MSAAIAHRIRCGSCSRAHESVAQVQECYAEMEQDALQAAAEAEVERQIERYFEEGPESYRLMRAAEEQYDRERSPDDPIWGL